ncbi:MAG: hypothetical protein QGG64_18180, partial [Candidatus Latescibacteria bacterium]|nr:hypothetical protein [Candidatus Latescibacterota bacterium]
DTKSRWFRSLLEFGDSPVDERITELMAEESETRPQRIQDAFEAGAKSDFSGKDRQLFDQMWLNRNLDEANKELTIDFQTELADLAECEEKGIQPGQSLYSLWRNPRLITFYNLFGSKNTQMPNRLTPETEQALLALLWARTRYKNDISVAQKSTWWIAGSENHDLNTKACNLLSARIFAKEPEYVDRIYPDFGYGDGIGYGESGYCGQGYGGGRANWADGKAYNAVDHYDAWLSYLNDYFNERAKRGFFLENGSPTYMKYTIGYILMLYNFCNDEGLKKKIHMFLDLMWADWAQLQIVGLRGGPKTRHHKDAGGYDSMSELATFYLGGEGKTSFNYPQQLLSDYAWPRIVWELALDRKGLGSFAYISRGIGEEEPTCPRPLGTERTMMGDTPSRFVKYTWVTPDYTLGTQMDHPYALFNHLSVAGRWQGLVTSDPNARLVTIALDTPEEESEDNNAYDMELVYHSIQHKQVLITQQRRRWAQSNPDWYPANDDRYDRAFGLFLGNGWDQIDEKDGWIFAEKENVYVAIRVILLEAESDAKAWAKGTDSYRGNVVLRHDSYRFNKDRTILQLTNRYSPILIEAGRKADHPTLESFERMILQSQLTLHRTVVTRETGVVVVYKSAAPDMVEMVFNAANTSDVPTIGGEYVDYEHPKVFDSPYIQSNYGSGLVEISKGVYKLSLDFNNNARHEC